MVDGNQGSDDVRGVRCRSRLLDGTAQCHQLQSFWCHSSSGGGCGGHLFCCKSLSNLIVDGSFGSHELGLHDNSNTRVLSYFFPGLLVPIARIAKSDSTSMDGKGRMLNTPVKDTFQAL